MSDLIASNQQNEALTDADAQREIGLVVHSAEQTVAELRESRRCVASRNAERGKEIPEITDVGLKPSMEQRGRSSRGGEMALLGERNDPVMRETTQKPTARRRIEEKRRCDGRDLSPIRTNRSDSRQEDPPNSIRNMSIKHYDRWNGCKKRFGADSFDAESQRSRNNH